MTLKSNQINDGTRYDVRPDHDGTCREIVWTRSERDAKRGAPSNPDLNATAMLEFLRGGGDPGDQMAVGKYAIEYANRHGAHPSIPLMIRHAGNLTETWA